MFCLRMRPFFYKHPILQNHVEAKHCKITCGPPFVAIQPQGCLYSCSMTLKTPNSRVCRRNCAPEIPCLRRNISNKIGQKIANTKLSATGSTEPFCAIPLAMSHYSWLAILSQKLGPIRCLGSGKKPVFRFYVVFCFPVNYCIQRTVHLGGRFALLGWV